MKSEPGTPLMRDSASAAGTSVSAAATCIVGGSADGARAGGCPEAARDSGGVRAVAVPATAPVRESAASELRARNLACHGTSPRQDAMAR